MRIRLVIAGALFGCLAAAQASDLATATFQPRLALDADPAAASAVHDARKLLVSADDPDQARAAALKLVEPHIASSSAAAEFAIGARLLDVDPAGPDMSNARLLRLKEGALRVLIQGGVLQYLPMYWGGLQAQASAGAPNVFREDLAVPATAYLAEHDQDSTLGGWAQLQLAQYWLKGCATPPARATQCTPNAEQALLFTKMYAANRSISIEDRMAAAEDIEERIAIMSVLDSN